MSHLTVAKASAVGISDGKPNMILAARQCCLFNDLNNSVWRTLPHTGIEYVMEDWIYNLQLKRLAHMTE